MPILAETFLHWDLLVTVDSSPTSGRTKNHPRALNPPAPVQHLSGKDLMFSIDRFYPMWYNEYVLDFLNDITANAGFGLIYDYNRQDMRKGVNHDGTACYQL